MEYEMTYEEVTNMLNLASEKEIDFECFEGVLLDSYIIFNHKGMYLKGLKQQTNKDFILIDVVPMNEWQSKYVVTFTNKEKEMEDFRDRKYFIENELESSYK